MLQRACPATPDCSCAAHRAVHTSRYRGWRQQGLRGSERSRKGKGLGEKARARHRAHLRAKRRCEAFTSHGASETGWSMLSPKSIADGASKLPLTCYFLAAPQRRGEACRCGPCCCEHSEQSLHLLAVTVREQRRAMSPCAERCTASSAQSLTPQAVRAGQGALSPSRAAAPCPPAPLPARTGEWRA